jgi:microcystin-dependent protein
MDPFIGEIQAFAFPFVPGDDQWLECDGKSYPTGQYSSLYSVIGDRFGPAPAGMFKVPDLQGCIPVGMGTNSQGGAYQVGQSLGAESYSLTAANVPTHTHGATFTPTQPVPFAVDIQVSDGTPPARSPANAALDNSDHNVTTYAPADASPTGTLGGTGMQVNAGAATVNVGTAGLNPPDAYSAMPSTLVLHYGIACAGTYPVRSSTP